MLARPRDLLLASLAGARLVLRHDEPALVSHRHHLRHAAENDQVSVLVYSSLNLERKPLRLLRQLGQSCLPPPDSADEAMDKLLLLLSLEAPGPQLPDLGDRLPGRHGRLRPILSPRRLEPVHGNVTRKQGPRSTLASSAVNEQGRLRRVVEEPEEVVDLLDGRGVVVGDGEVRVRDRLPLEPCLRQRLLLCQGDNMADTKVRAAQGADVRLAARSGHACKEERNDPTEEPRQGEQTCGVSF
eukprot:763655-Hanusia_phi.AAC.2